MSNYTKDTIEKEMSCYKALGSLDQFDTVVSSEISSIFNAIRTDLSGKLDVLGKGCYAENIENGVVAQGTQTSAFGDDSFVWGKNSVAGAKGWYYKAVDTAKHWIYLASSQVETSSDVKFGPNLEGIVPETGFEVPNNVIGGIICLVDNNKKDFGTTKVKSIVENTIIEYEGSLINTQVVAPAGGTIDYDDYSLFISDHPEAGMTGAVSRDSYAMGDEAKAIGREAHAEGRKTFVQGNYSHAEGRETSALAYTTHAEGYKTQAGVYGEVGWYSHAEGQSTKAVGSASHAAGLSTYAAGSYSYAEGQQTSALGVASHAEGYQTSAYGNYSHDEGKTTIASGDASHAEGEGSKSLGAKSHAEGYWSVAKGENAHAEGNFTRAFGVNSHSEGNLAFAMKDNDHAEGLQTIAFGTGSHAEGKGDYVRKSLTIVNETTLSTSNLASALSGYCSANGSLRIVTNDASLPARITSYEINGTSLSIYLNRSISSTVLTSNIYEVEFFKQAATGSASHVEGFNARANNSNAHAEGQNTLASGEDSHAEGNGSKATGNRSHAEGYYTKAYGANSHTEGYQANTGASATYSHAEGMFTKTTNQSEHAQGQYNVSNKKGVGGEFSVNADGNTLHSIGIGTSESTRKNAVEVMQNGDVYVKGIGGYEGTSYSGKKHLAAAISGINDDISDVNRRLNDYIPLSGAEDVGTIAISGELSVAQDVNVKGNFHALSDVFKVDHAENKDIIAGNAAQVSFSASSAKIYLHEADVEISGDNASVSANDAVEVYSPTLKASNDISAANDIYAAKHGLVGKDVDFSESGPETFAVGHEHHFFGKESFIAGNEGNVVGAKGFYWKAIDTTGHRIYLTTQRLTRYPGVVASQGSEKSWYTSDHSYDRPYFGPKENSALSTGDNDLFTAEDGINLIEDDVVSNGKTIVEGVKGKFITIWNCKYANYIRCFKALHVISGSIIEYEDLGTISPNDYKTYYRDKTRDANKPYTDNQYVMFFPEMDQAKISCDPNSYVRATTFGAAAIGESNTSLGYNSFAAGFTNRAEGHYSMSFGSYNKAQGYNSFAAGSNSVVGSNNAFGWSGNGQYVVSGDERAGTFNIKPQNGINGFWIGEHPLGYYLSSLSGTLSAGIERKLDKHDGGTVSAEVEILSSLTVRNSDVNILSGNYYQSNAASLSVKNYSYKNSFLQAECVYEVEGKHKEWGIACTGAKGYCILSVIPSLSAIKLSGDLSEIASAPNMLSSFSWAFGSTGNCQTLSIQTVDSGTGIVTLKHAIPNDLKAETSALTSEAQYVTRFDTDDNAFYCPGNPAIGNTIIHNFYAQHAEGGCVKAIGKYTHAEGRATIADMRYSHAEGDRTIAGRMAAHAEGQEAKAYGLYSHAEGKVTFVSHNATAAHAEGNSTRAEGNYSHAEGNAAKALAESTHAEGYNTTAKGNYSHAEGNRTSAFGLDSHAEGCGTLAASDYTHAEGFETSATQMLAHAEGYWTLAAQQGAHSEGGYYLNTTNRVRGGYCVHNAYAAHAEGLSTTVSAGIGAHAEGCGTYASGNGSHAEGGYWINGSPYIEGGTRAEGKASHAEGIYTIAKGHGSHAAGISAIAANNYSYVWNGSSSTQYNPGKGVGTYCINPDGNANGFYIGISSLQDYLDAAKSEGATEGSAEIKSCLKSTLSSLTLSPLNALNINSEISDVISATCAIRDILSALYDLAQG